MTRVELKRKSKEQIQGHIFKLFLLCMLSLSTLSSQYIINTFRLSHTLNLSMNMNTNFIVKIISNIILLLLFIISPAIGYSVSKLFLCITRKKEIHIEEFFKDISNLTIIGKILWLSTVQMLFLIGWYLLLIVPGIIKMISYSMSYYILADNPEMTALEAITESKRIMKGHKLDYFILELSFIGWYLLVGITFGIAYIYVGPYHKATVTNFYEHIKNKSSKVEINQ